MQADQVDEANWMDAELEDTTPEPEPDLSLEMSPDEAEARQYLAEYTGQFAFLCDVKDKVIRRKWHFSPGQIAGVLKCKAREVKQDAKVPSGPKVEIMDGFYVLPQQDGSLAIYKVQESLNKPNAYYAKVYDPAVGGFAYEQGLIGRLPYMAGIREMSKEEAMHFAAHVSRNAEGELYGRCFVCGRRLTDENSIAKGIGPVCEEGW